MSFVNIPRQELEGPQVPAGDHPARIHSVKMRESSNKNQVMNIMWHITGSEPPAGTGVLDSITLVPEAYWKLNLLFGAVEYTPDETGFHTEDLMGKECKITVTEDEYQGSKRMKVTGYKKV